MNKPDDFDVWRLPDDGLVEKVRMRFQLSTRALHALTTPSRFRSR